MAIKGQLSVMGPPDMTSLPEADSMPSRRESRHAHSDKLGLLRHHPVFGGLDAEHIDRLCTYATTRSYPRGSTIFTKGDPGTSLFAVCSGTVRIGVPSPDGRDAVFNLIGEGEIFGEIALLDGQPRTADASAMTSCELMVIDRRDFVALLRGQPEIALKVIEVLCARVRRTSQQVEDVLFLDLPGRLAKQLLRLIDGTECVAGRHKVSMTQRELGQMIGMSRESTNKQLREWEERDWVRLERGGIVVVARDALAAIATPNIDR
jgi:CRP/FNR family transcriptional regulator, cyclic AMP receptor protein